MTDIVSNQFKMSNASFSGLDKNGEPFYIHAATGRRPGIINIRKYGQFGANCFEFDWYGSTIKRQAKGTDRGMYTQQSGNNIC